MNNENMNPQNEQQAQPQYQQPQPQQQAQPQYQQPQPQYQQPYYQKPPRNPNDGLGFSITALVIGCCGVLFCWSGILNFIILACGIIAIIMGNIGRKKSIMAYGKASGLATAGFILGIIGTAISGIGTISCIACMGCYSCSACAVL